MSTTSWSEERRRALETNDFSTLLARVPYAAFLGVSIHLEGGEPRFRLPFRPSLVGTPETQRLHGGVTAGFMENAAMLHLLIAQDEPRVPKSIDFSIDYLRAGDPSDLHAACSVVRQGRRVALVQVRCWQDEARPGLTREVALARVHCLLASRPDG